MMVRENGEANLAVNEDDFLRSFKKQGEVSITGCGTAHPSILFMPLDVV
jgi:hypothetical protein